MRMIVMCEYSGTVRDAFAAKGWDAWSCDILPTERTGNHFQGDARKYLKKGWDLMIGHPPCTFLSSAGLHFCRIEVHGNKAIERIKERNKAVEFFLDLWSAPIEHIALENPVGFISSTILKPTQIIHPYYFGERQMKRTALWLKNLPPLTYRLQNDLFGKRTASDIPDANYIDVNGKKRYFTDTLWSNVNGGGGDKRSKTFQSIADAMAEQWTEYFISKNS